ncbi:hypothetical protein [Flavobacterium sp.]|uniref:hypothetical protein n=1 Tax=Flavobacterium sp. TaxID=239 RepID=UPI0039E55681
MILIKSKKDLLIKLPLGIVIIALFGISPILVSMVMSRITEFLTNEPCHEGNCIWGGLGWLFLLTIPLAVIFFFLFLIICLVDILKLARLKN